MKRVSGLLSLVFLVSASLTAATIWTETGARFDETIAHQATVPPPSALQPLLARVPFSNFRYPHVDVEGNVTFIADDPVRSGNPSHHGIYRSLARTGELQALVRQGETVVPGTSVPLAWLRGLQMDGRDFVFNATDTADARGLYYWSDGKLETIARTGVTVLPGTHGALTEVEYGAVSGGRVLYNAIANGENLLVLHSLRDGTVRILARSGDSIPDRPGASFRYFSPQNWLDPAHIVFRGASVVDPHQKGAAGTRGIYSWREIDWRQPDVSLGNDRLHRIADASVPVPLLDKTARFDDFRSAPVKDNLIAFVGGGAGFSGIYYCDLAAADGAAIRPVVDTQTELQGLFPGAFKRFAIFCTVFDKSVVFVGYGANNYVGVFLYRTDRDELFLLTDNRVAMGGKRIRNFEIAGHFLVRDRFAVSAQFADGSYGVYLATIPSHSFKRMVTPAQ